MANFPLLFQLILSVISVHNVNTNFLSEYDPIRLDVFSKRSFNISHVVNEILIGDWMDNIHCLVELNAIKNGLVNFDEWAVKLVNSWGNLFPSGVLSGNSFDAGSFSQCFHIERNGKEYKTKYCIGTLMFQPKNPTKRNKVWTRIYDGPDISIGLCFPAECSSDHLEKVINTVFHTEKYDMRVEISKNTCQTQEYATELKPLDWTAIVLLGTVFLLMIFSTLYDIFCILLNRTKYQPFLVFSVYTNGKKLFPHENPKIPNAINCIDGIRALSIMWIVLIHSSWKYIGLPLQDKTEYSTFLSSYIITIPFATIVVDTYFTISGILVSDKMLKVLKRNGKLDILSLYLRRYLRLTPLLGVTILVTMSLLRFSSSGPIWPQLQTFLNGRCDKYWWSALLYIQNYANDYGTCLSQTWYLSIDMQLFIIAPVLVYSFHRFRTKTLIISIISILICMGWTWTLYVRNDFTKIYQQGLVIVYVPTHIRFTSWLVGFITGCILVDYPAGSVHIPKKVNLCAWAVSLAMLAAVLVGNYPYLQSNSITTAQAYGLYSALSHVAWGIAICYIIFACANNAGGPIDWLLSHPFWQPISKLSYAIYMVHFAVIMITTSMMTVPLRVSKIAAIQHFFGDFVLSFLIAIPATLAFEMPIDAMDKLIFSSTPKKREKKFKKRTKTEQNPMKIQ